MKRQKGARAPKMKIVAQGLSDPQRKTGISAAVWTLRNRLSWKQSELSETIHIAVGTLARAESGERVLSPEIALQLGQLASKHGFEDLARVFRNYVTQRVDFRSLDPAQRSLSEQQLAVLQELKMTLQTYRQILRKNLQLLAEALKQPNPDWPRVQVQGQLVEQVGLQFDTELGRLSEALLPTQQQPQGEGH